MYGFTVAYEKAKQKRKDTTQLIMMSLQVTTGQVVVGVISFEIQVFPYLIIELNIYFYGNDDIISNMI